MSKFVLSASEFKDIKSAEKKAEEWQEDETLKKDTKLYAISAVYDLKLKFVKRKEKNATTTQK